ncbi:MAG: Potassium efflux system KefA protein / Small-conductance mechanosensitive channel [Candidatus Saccharibacteria bacterium]|nr:Potassium efflux system KefA protein / Small-conductance mechanosensitive channel [Candidatus Saccharibacteria bacterium]
MFADISNGLNGSAKEIMILVGNWFDQHLVNIVVILIVAWLVRRFGHDLVSRLLRHTVRPDLYPTKSDRDKRVRTLDSMIGATTRVAVYVIAIILIIGEINPDYTTALFASAGLMTVAIGFGAQSLIKDFVSGMFIITENQYRVGDTVDIAGVSGTVEDVTIRTTVLRDINGHVHHVPNGIIDVTTNKTMGFSRLNEDIIVDFETDLEQVEHIINHVGEEMAAMPEYKDIIKEAPSFGSLKGYAPNGLIIGVTAETTANKQWGLRTDMYKRLKKEFDKHGIEVMGIPTVPVAATGRRKKK